MNADAQKELDRLGQDIDRMNRRILGNLAERGTQLLRQEIKASAYQTGNLMQGVAPPDVDYELMEATLTVSATRGRTGVREATLIGADGEEKKRVTLRPQPAFDYAEKVATGRKALLSPKYARAFLVPVSHTPRGSYLLADNGQKYVVRRSIGEVKPNPYDERAAARLEAEAEKIVEAQLLKFEN